jgi:hypothetical protein
MKDEYLLRGRRLTIVSFICKQMDATGHPYKSFNLVFRRTSYFIIAFVRIVSI